MDIDPYAPTYIPAAYTSSMSNEQYGTMNMPSSGAVLDSTRVEGFQDPSRERLLAMASGKSNAGKTRERHEREAAETDPTELADIQARKDKDAQRGQHEHIRAREAREAHAANQRLRQPYTTEVYDHNPAFRTIDFSGQIPAGVACPPSANIQPDETIYESLPDFVSGSGHTEKIKYPSPSDLRATWNKLEKQQKDSRNENARTKYKDYKDRTRNAEADGLPPPPARTERQREQLARERQAIGRRRQGGVTQKTVRFGPPKERNTTLVTPHASGQNTTRPIGASSAPISSANTPEERSKAVFNSYVLRYLDGGAPNGTTANIGSSVRTGQNAGRPSGNTQAPQKANPPAMNQQESAPGASPGRLNRDTIVNDRIRRQLIDAGALADPRAMDLDRPTVNPMQNFSCPLCGDKKQLSTKHVLIRHIRLKHPKVYDMFWNRA